MPTYLKVCIFNNITIYMFDGQQAVNAWKNAEIKIKQNYKQERKIM